MKARVAIFNLNKRATIWWEHFKQVKRISERKLKGKQFKKYFRQKYLSDRYYDDKIKDFHELRLGQQIMDEYANKFLELLRYVWYIKDEKVKIQWFLSGFPQAYKDRNEFYEPWTLEEAIRKAKYCYEQRKGKSDYHKAWKDKKNEKFEQKENGFKASHFRNQQQKKPPQNVNKLAKVMGENPSDPREIIKPIQC